MTRIKDYLLILSLAAVGIYGWIFITSNTSQSNSEFSYLSAEGKYQTGTPSTEEGSTARIYNIQFNNAQQNILTFNEIGAENLSKGWIADELIKFPIPNEFNFDKSAVSSSHFATYDEQSNTVVLVDYTNENLTEIRLEDNHPSISQIAFIEDRLILLIDEFFEEKNLLIKRSVNLNDYSYRDAAIEVDFGNKINLESLSVSSKSSIESIDRISGRALDVWEQGGSQESPIVLSAVNGDYIVSNGEGELFVITFGGELLKAFESEELFYRIIQ